MRKLPVILGLLLLLCVFFPACEVENCPPNSMSYAYFSLVDQNGRSFSTSDTITIVGQTHANIVVYDTLTDGSLRPRTVDSLISDTLVNREAGAKSFELPLSYTPVPSSYSVTTVWKGCLPEEIPSVSRTGTFRISSIWTAAR